PGLAGSIGGSRGSLVREGAGRPGPPELRRSLPWATLLLGRARNNDRFGRPSRPRSPRGDDYTLIYESLGPWMRIHGTGRQLRDRPVRPRRSRRRQGPISTPRSGLSRGNPHPRGPVLPDCHATYPDPRPG